MIVLDASVVLKWLFESESSTASLRYRDGHTSGSNPIAVPELLFYEIANVLGSESALPPGEARNVFEAIYDMELESYHLAGSDYLRAMTLSQRFNISGYDASYVALAEKLDAPFVTADKKLVRRCAELGFVTSPE